MRKEEFLEKLRARLSQTMSVQEVTAQVHYYENYIQEQMRNGRSEEEVLAELGDPLLIAKAASGWISKAPSWTARCRTVCPPCAGILLP